MKKHDRTLSAVVLFIFISMKLKPMVQTVTSGIAKQMMVWGTRLVCIRRMRHCLPQQVDVVKAVAHALLQGIK